MSAATRQRDAIVANLERGQIRKTRSTDRSKREQRDFAMFQKGVVLGARLEKARILNATAGMTYEDEVVPAVAVLDDSVPVVDGELATPEPYSESESNPS